MLLLQIKEKQEQLEKIAEEIRELKRISDVVCKEKDMSSDEDLSKVYTQEIANLDEHREKEVSSDSDNKSKIIGNKPSL